MALPKKLSLVAVPLGNLADLSPRAREALQSADLVFCEDTRRSQELFRRTGIQASPRWVALPGSREKEIDFSQFTEGPQVQSWAFVSDAGTPIVNDPGLEILQFCRRQNVAVEAIPGPSAPILAWQWSGGFGLPFTFAGFAPKAKSSDNKALKDFFALATSIKTFVYFDTRHQAETTLGYLENSEWKNAKMWMAREMTKSHEELTGGSAHDCAEILRHRLSSEDGVGELTFVLEGRGQSEIHPFLSLEQLLEIRLSAPKQAAKIIAEVTGRNSSEVYKAIIEAKK